MKSKFILELINKTTYNFSSLKLSSIIIATMIIFLLISQALQAKTTILKLGLNAMQFRETNSTPLPGFTIGFGNNYRLTDHASLETEFLYIFQGSILNNRIIFKDYPDS